MAKLPKDEITPVTEAIDAYVKGVTTSLQLLSEASQRAVSDATRIHEPDTRPETAVKNAALVWSTWARKMGKMAADAADGIALLAKIDGPTVLLSVDTLALPAADEGHYWLEADKLMPLKWSQESLPESQSVDEKNVVEIAFRAADSGLKIEDVEGHRLKRENGKWTTEARLQITIPRDSDRDVPVGVVSGNILLRPHPPQMSTLVFPFYGQLA